MQFAAGYLVSEVINGVGMDTVALVFWNQAGCFDLVQVCVSLMLASVVWVLAEKPFMNVANWMSRGT